MKKLSIVLGGLVLVGIVGYISFKEETVTATNTVTEYVDKIVEVPVNTLDEQIEKRKLELEDKYENIQAIEAELDVNNAEIARLQARNKDLGVELAHFTQATTSKR